MVGYVYHGREGRVYKNDQLVAMVSGITIEVNPNITGIREHGSREVQEWKSGDLEITGRIERMWYEFSFLEDALADVPTEYTLKTVATREDTGETKTLTLNGVVFNTVSIEWGADDMTTESVDFMAKSITTS